ncbi:MULTISPECIES: formylglycine-generating enzyme family protein [unclassified Luteimonas]|uniref:formylglycine-generating enzyme family protein n=1 Tax=unclassified Luteimonas TaxID=2629088 RepID=UPI0018F10139|nr:MULTISPECIES: formylglycine-generating enzyme family protein [unclassified Luteimonas]MBJ6980575.1 formylglycine-generating enzyme family protein [Luteimonas sp. MC1572]MBJ7574161.1 formylglycine-generating enzyme family protein [Luteimonas sp. MC1828]QQO01959.1 formylglycine-generating enzyme family protein [Luteimonas sp. MC1572]
MRRLAALLLLLPLAGLAAGGGDYVKLPGGAFRTALKYEDRTGPTRIAPFAMMRTPVSNARFLAFVRTHPEWRRDRVASVMAEPRYLSHWAGPVSLGETARPDQPVVQVSWFAAQAYCEAEGARLPTWDEWEYAAAADETRTDARRDPRWRERILSWYSRPSNAPLQRVGLQAPNAYGVQELHGLVWEWTEDASALMIAEDNRNQGDADNARFCGAGALSMDDRDNYAVLMRVAMLSSLGARDTTANMGFRCAKDLP